MESMDICMIILFLVAVSFIIGLNIVSVVDRKLGNVEINVPPINVPKPTLIVNVNKANGEIESFVEDKACKMVKQENNNNNTQVEHFAGTIKQEGKSEQKSELKEKIEKIRIKTQTNEGSKADILNPDQIDVVQYDDYVCYRKGYVPPEEIKADKKEKLKCDNNSLNEKFSYGSKYTQNMSTCQQKSWEDIDPADFYKTMYRPRPAVMEDEILKGYNINRYDTSTEINNIGMIDLKSNRQYPKGNSYIESNVKGGYS
jgi:hypothetical protein